MRLVWLSGTLALLLLGGLAWYLEPLEPGVFALQLAFTPRAFGDIIHLWSAENLARYRIHLLMDFGLILAYSVFGYSLASRVRMFASRSRFWSWFARWCLPCAGALDVVENVLHGWLTEVPRFDVPLVYTVSASCSLAKWLLLAAFALLVAYAAARAET
jgi:hypothetical protein